MYIKFDGRSFYFFEKNFHQIYAIRRIEKPSKEGVRGVDCPKAVLTSLTLPPYSHHLNER